MATETILDLPVSRQVPPPTTAEQAVVLHVDWGQYKSLRDNPENRHRRMTFDRGVLEIMTLGPLHELISSLIDYFILTWQMKQNIPLRPTGSMTLGQELLDRGLEGDRSYYIQHEADVRGLEAINLDSAPPPDLAIEVDHTSSSVEKMPIYVSLGVPEVWRWHRETLSVYRLADGEYVEVPKSETLPGFPLDKLRAALTRRDQTDAATLVREFWQDLQSNN